MYGPQNPPPLPWNVIGSKDATDGWELITNPDPRVRKEWGYDAEAKTGHYAVVFTPTRTGPCAVVVIAADGGPGLSRAGVDITEGKALADRWVCRQHRGSSYSEYGRCDDNRTE